MLAQGMISPVRAIGVVCALLMVVGVAAAATVAAVNGSFIGTRNARAFTERAPTSTLVIAAEDSMKPFFEIWVVEFRKQNPDIKLEINRAHRPPENRSALGPNTDEVFRRTDAEFVSKYGYLPLNIAIASGGRHVIGTIQALGVYVHPSNPLRRLTLEQVDAIFSANPRGGQPPLRKWGQLGLTGEWSDRAIVAYGRERKQGASNFFRNRALGAADYAEIYRECANSTAVIDAVAGDIAGIGYSALAYGTPKVRALALAEREGGVTGRPTEEDVASLAYPLAYPLFISVNRAPGQPLDPAIKAFLTYALSAAAQEIVAKSGYLPLPPNAAQWELAKLQ
jgi:phosphate transport system substrate-binding protein